MKKAIHIVCIIVNWNGKVHTIACLNSIKKINTYGNRVTVLVVDNGSSDNSAEEIARVHPWVTVLETGKNLGFTGGNNVGITWAQSHNADYVWFLNNDTLVHVNVLSFLTTFEDPHVGVVGSKIYFGSGHEYHRHRYKNEERGKVIWYAGGIIDWNNMYASHRGVDEVDTGKYEAKEETQFITGCSMIIRGKLLARIGSFDDKFYLYLEDVDLSLRAKKADFKLMYDPSSIVWHMNAGSSGGSGSVLHDYYLTRNRLLMGFRWAPFRTKVALSREAIKFILGANSIKRRAVFDAVFGRWGRQYVDS